MSETEKPTIPESIFVYTMNLVKIDAARSILSKLTPCDILKQDDINDLVLTLSTMQKEHDNSFDVIAEEFTESEKTNDPELTEEKMGDDHADEEGDVNQNKPIDFEDVG